MKFGDNCPALSRSIKLKRQKLVHRVPAMPAAVQFGRDYVHQTDMADVNLILMGSGGIGYYWIIIRVLAQCHNNHSGNQLTNETRWNEWELKRWWSWDNKFAHVCLYAEALLRNLPTISATPSHLMINPEINVKNTEDDLYLEFNWQKLLSWNKVENTILVQHTEEEQQQQQHRWRQGIK